MRRSFALMEVLVSSAILAIATATIWSHINSVTRSYYLDGYALASHAIVEEMTAQWTAYWITHPLPFTQYQSPCQESVSITHCAIPYTIIRKCKLAPGSSCEQQTQKIELLIAVIPPYVDQQDIELCMQRDETNNPNIIFQKLHLCVKKAL